MAEVRARFSISGARARKRLGRTVPIFMRILQIHNYYRTPGGECRVVDDERLLLEQHGEDVYLYSKHSKDIDTYSWWRRIRTLQQVPLNRAIVGELTDLVRRLCPDVAHVHNVFPMISVGIYDVLHALGIPVVQTVHNYRFLCPNGTFFVGGKVCEDCSTADFGPCVRKKCMHGSRVVSHYYARAISRGWSANIFPSAVTRFLALNEFTAGRLEQSGIARSSIRICPNFVTVPMGEADRKEPFALYLGRLSEEKGLWTLLKAVEMLPAGARVVIAGTGPQETMLRRYADSRLRGMVSFAGYVSGEEKFKLIRRAACVVVPSEWYENCPISVLEALACGTAVVASAIGGLPELVRNGETGCLFDPGSVEQLAGALRSYIENPRLAVDHGVAAQRLASEQFSGEVHYRGLRAAYEDARACAG